MFTDVLFDCNFDGQEDDMCILEQQENDQFDWTWISGMTPSDVTGPQAGHTAPGYMYTNTDAPRTTGELAKYDVIINYYFI